MKTITRPKRMNILNATNRLFETVDYEIAKDIDITEVYDILFDYFVPTRKSTLKSKIEIKNGCLYIDNEFVKRVAPLHKPFNTENKIADYYENRILAKQGC